MADQMRLDAEFEMTDEDIASPFLPIRKEEFRAYDIPMAISEIMSRLIKGRLDLQPEYQRGYVWDDDQARGFIDSIWNGIPMPPIFILAQGGKWQIIDGQQRLTSIFRFYYGQDPKPNVSLNARLFERLNRGDLKELYVPSSTFSLPESDNLSYCQIPKEKTDRFEDLAIPLIVIEPNEFAQQGTVSGLVIEIFRRLNTGGVPLSKQEIRHCIFPSKLLENIRDLSFEDEWKRFFPYWTSKFEKNPSLYADYALRAVALHQKFAYENYKSEYRQPIPDFLDDYAKWVGKQDLAYQDEVYGLLRKSILALSGAYGGFVSEIFRHFAEEPEGRSVYNIGYLDVILVGCMEWVRQNPDNANLPKDTMAKIEGWKESGKAAMLIRQNSSSKEKNVKEKVSAGIELFRELS